MQISEKGLDLIKRFEKFVPHYYKDAVGVGTIGYGTTYYINGTHPKPGDTITELAATDLLIFTVKGMMKAIAPHIHTTLNQNQMDAVVSLIYNIGIANFYESTVLRRINGNPNSPLIADAFNMWKYGTVEGKHVILAGLVIRRKLEGKLYLSPLLKQFA